MPEYNKANFVEGDFARKGSDGDIDNGDIVTILDAGQITQGKPFQDPQTGETKPPKDVWVFSIQTKNGPKNASFNTGSMNAMSEAFGTNTDTWIGRQAQVHYSVIANRCYFAPVGWTPRSIKTKNNRVMTVFDPPSPTRPAAPAPDPMSTAQGEFPGSTVAARPLPPSASAPAAQTRQQPEVSIEDVPF